MLNPLPVLPQQRQKVPQRHPLGAQGSTPPASPSDSLSGSSAQYDNPFVRRCRTPDGTSATPSPASTSVNTPDHVDDVFTI